MPNTRQSSSIWLMESTDSLIEITGVAGSVSSITGTLVVVWLSLAETVSVCGGVSVQPDTNKTIIQAGRAEMIVWVRRLVIDGFDYSGSLEISRSRAPLLSRRMTISSLFSLATCLAKKRASTTSMPLGPLFSVTTRRAASSLILSA